MYLVFLPWKDTNATVKLDRDHVLFQQKYYQGLTLPQLNTLTFDNVDFHVITLVDYVPMLQFVYFGASLLTTR